MKRWTAHASQLSAELQPDLAHVAFLTKIPPFCLVLLIFFLVSL